MNPQINSPMVSKINYLALIIFAVNMAGLLGYMPDEWTAQILTVVNTAGPGLIMVARTWFTDKTFKP